MVMFLWILYLHLSICVYDWPPVFESLYEKWRLGCDFHLDGILHLI
jgi:hypothetical protein